MKTESRSGYIAIVGRPNVGKSTLLNCLLGQKVSITSPKPQTTRTQILGIKTVDETQAVYIDTPGMHRVEKRAMNRYMNRLANAVMIDADVVVFVIEANRWNEEDELALEKLRATHAPVILAINKVDLVRDKNMLLPFIEKITDKFTFSDIVPFSAKKADNVDALEKTIMQKLPAGPHLFPDDQSEQFQVAEIIREKLIKATEQELPYSTTVSVESMKLENNVVHISAIIWVERDGQKAIVIGKGGDMLKKIGTQARKDIEKLVDQKVFLRLWVKVKSDWTDDERSLNTLGYQ
jgi:GTP-binding protein Era